MLRERKCHQVSAVPKDRITLRTCLQLGAKDEIQLRRTVRMIEGSSPFGGAPCNQSMSAVGSTDLVVWLFRVRRGGLRGPQLACFSLWMSNWPVSWLVPIGPGQFAGAVTPRIFPARFGGSSLKCHTHTVCVPVSGWCKGTMKGKPRHFFGSLMVMLPHDGPPSQGG